MSSKKGSKIKSIPSSESSWVRGVVNGEEKYVVTSCPPKINRKTNTLITTYNLWEIVDGGFMKIASSDNPLDFDKIMFKKE
jgi:hypothetical protein